MTSRLDQATPLLRWGRALLKLDLLRPSGSTAGRVAALREWRDGVLDAPGNAAIAAAEWARGAKLTIVPRGVFTYEMKETLKLWGAQIDPAAQPTLPSLDDVPLFAQTLGAELIAQLTEAPAVFVCPAGERAALFGALVALRGKWPSVRGVAVLAKDEELPDLPLESALPPAIERVFVSRAQAAEARRRVARELGLLTSHASAAAAVHAHDRGGVALITAAGEREFSLERE